MCSIQEKLISFQKQAASTLSGVTLMETVFTVFTVHRRGLSHLEWKCWTYSALRIVCCKSIDK